MYSRRSNVSEYVSPSHDDGRGYYFGDASSASTAAVAPMPQRHSDRRSYSPIGRSGIYEIQPYISSADVHVFPESITVTPGRKTIMVGRKESPQMVPRQYQYLGSPYNVNEGLEDGDFRLSGAGRRPDMVYKTTMITQVTPRDASSGRDSPLRQSPQHGRQDSRLFHISVEPTSPSSQPEYVRYSSSPEAVQRSSAMRKSQSNSDWSGQGQTHYLQCSPDQRFEISFQHRLPTQSNQAHQFYRDRSPQAVGLREQFFRPDQQQWRGHGEFGDSFLQSPRPQSRTPPPEPQAVPSRLVYSPQTPNQSIAYSKKVEKKTPSHCSSIMIVPGGAKKAAEEEGSGRQQNSETKQPTDPKTGFLQSMDGSKVDKEAEIDELTNLLVQNMQMTGHPEFFGMCSSCGRAIMGTTNGCSALGRLYHVTCFICGVCRIPLKQKPFFSLDGVTFCEHCYSTTVERCSECNEPITEKMLRAVGKQYHPGCFKCCSCRTSLDGRAFTLDAGGKVLCLEDFNRKYAPRCTGCGKMIVPLEGKGEAERVVVLDRNYHLECHRCEDCGKHLSSRFGGEGCFPLDDSILCGRCNAHRMERLTNPGSTNV